MANFVQTTQNRTHMTTQEIANRYADMASQNKWAEIQQELYSDDVTSREPEKAVENGFPVFVQGREALKAKGEKHRGRIETFHGRSFQGPIVSADSFAMVLNSEVTFNGQTSRSQLSEIAVFQVKNGKIISEQFFY